MYKVCLVMPTFQSRAYFSRSFKELERAAKPLAARYDVTILVVLNGSEEVDRVEVERVLLAAELKTELIVTAQSGQNNATNTGLDYCRANNQDIVQLVDDDQFYSDLTLLTNIETLISMKERLGVLGLVGSRHLAPVEGWDGPTAWIASLAFEDKEESPRFCIGGSICTWVSEFPALPPDSVGIANDAYVCNTFYSRFRDLYLKTGFMPIVFPKDSLIYFNVSRDFREYMRQQVRIRYGVLSAYRAFPEIQEELRAFFNWKFHCDDRLNVKKGIIDLLRWTVFRFLRRKANRLAESRIAEGIVGIEWGVAHSSKKLEKLGLKAEQTV